jgi:hypothetical protein
LSHARSLSFIASSALGPAAPAIAIEDEPVGAPAAAAGGRIDIRSDKHPFAIGSASAS